MFLVLQNFAFRRYCKFGTWQKKAVGLDYHNKNFVGDHAFLYITFPL